MRKNDPLRIGCAPGWSRYPDNPIMGDSYGETYDLSIVHLDDGRMRMYLSIRGNRSIGYSESDNGFHFERLDEPVLKPDALWENSHLQCLHISYDAERKVYRMWFSGGGHWEADRIGYAERPDSIHWTKSSQNRFLSP